MYFPYGKGQLISEKDMEEKVENVISHLYGVLPEGMRTIEVMEDVIERAKKSLHEYEIVDPKNRIG